MSGDEAETRFTVYSLHLLDDESFLEKLISLGEGNNLEFKKKLPLVNEMSKDISAFANTKGGLILYGIDDSRNIFGLDDTDLFFQRMEDAFVRTEVTPRGLSWKIIHYKGKEIGAILVNPSKSGPIITKGSILRRIGVTNVPIRREDYPVLIEERNISTSIEISEASILEFIKKADEDAITETLIIPLLRHIGFQAVVGKRHDDKSLEFGQDIKLFKYQLPTGHWLYFAAQVKNHNINYSYRGNEKNIANILTQLNMAFNYEIFDYQMNASTLPDHLFLITTGNINEGAKQYLQQNLSRDKNRKIMFWDTQNIMESIYKSGLPMGNQIEIREYIKEIFLRDNYIEELSAHLFFPANVTINNRTLEYHKQRHYHRLIINHKTNPPEAYYLTPDSFGWKYIEQFPEIWVSENDPEPDNPNFTE